MDQTLQLQIYPKQCLREKSNEIIAITPRIINIGQQMLDIMYTNNGVGLASNQVGILERIIVIDLQIDDVKNPIILINPKIIKESKHKIPTEEGCLSLPGISEEVLRPDSVEVEYMDIKGEKQTIIADGLMCVCLQHEIDHLNGILFVDRLSNMKKKLILNKFNKLMKNKD